MAFQSGSTIPSAALGIRQKDRQSFADEERRRSVIVSTPLSPAQKQELTRTTHETCRQTRSDNTLIVCPTPQKAFEVRDYCRSQGYTARIAAEGFTLVLTLHPQATNREIEPLIGEHAIRHNTCDCLTRSSSLWPTPRPSYSLMHGIVLKH